MTNRLLLHLFVWQDVDTDEITANADVRPIVLLDTQLDGRMALAAQVALAEASPAFNAELEASTHMLERLEQITRNATVGQFDAADPAMLLDTPPHCQICGREIVADETEGVGWAHADPVFVPGMTGYHFAVRREP